MASCYTDIILVLQVQFVVVTCSSIDMGICSTVSLSKAFHHPIDLLCLARKTEAPEELSQRLHKDHVTELVQVHKRLQHVHVEVIALPKVVSDGCLVETLYRRRYIIYMYHEASSYVVREIFVFTLLYSVIVLSGTIPSAWLKLGTWTVYLKIGGTTS